MARGSLSATAVAGRVGFGRRGSRTPTVGGRLRHFGRWLRTQCNAVVRMRRGECRCSRVMSRSYACCRWVMSTTTCVSPVWDGLRPPRWPWETSSGASHLGCRVSPRLALSRRVRFTNWFTESARTGDATDKGTAQRRRHRHSRYVGTEAGGSTKRSASSPASSRPFRKVDSVRCVAPTRIRTPSGLWSGEVHQPSDS